MRFDIDRKALSLVASGLGVVVAVISAAPSALAQPDGPAPPPPAPVDAPAGDVAPPPPPFDPFAFLRPAPAPAPVEAAPVAAAPLPTPPDGMSHLASPDALPPGATIDPTGRGNESPNVSYLKDLWHAVQNQEISGGEALLLGIAQRGMDTPYPEQPPGPNVPISPAGPALDAPPPADLPPPPPPDDAPPPPPPPPPAPAPLMPWLP